MPKTSFLPLRSSPVSAIIHVSNFVNDAGTASFPKAIIPPSQFDGLRRLNNLIKDSKKKVRKGKKQSNIATAYSLTQPFGRRFALSPVHCRSTRSSEFSTIVLSSL